MCFKLSLSHLSCSDRAVCAHALVHLWLCSCMREGNIMYPITPSFHLASLGQLKKNLPLTFQLFYWAEMFSLARRIAENPPNYTCHAAWSSPLWQHGLTKWFTCFLSWIGATPLISQHYKGWGGSLDFQKNQYWYHILNSTVPASSQTLSRCSSEFLSQLPINILEGKRHRDKSSWSEGWRM